MQSIKTLFDSLAIGKTGPGYLDKMGKHPVIYLTFKNIWQLDWKTTLRCMRQLIQDQYLKYNYLLDSPSLKPQDHDYFKRVLNLKGDYSDLVNSLRKLLIFLNRHYGERVVILIDEYDLPIHAGFNSGYHDEIIGFMRNFLGRGLKDTGQYLEKGVFTGIMSLAGESIFSDLNNLEVYTLLADEFSEQFGFTEKELENLFRRQFPGKRG